MTGGVVPFRWVELVPTIPVLLLRVVEIPVGALLRDRRVHRAVAVQRAGGPSHVARDVRVRAMQARMSSLTPAAPMVTVMPDSRSMFEPARSMKVPATMSRTRSYASKFPRTASTVPKEWGLGCHIAGADESPEGL